MAAIRRFLRSGAAMQQYLALVALIAVVGAAAVEGSGDSYNTGGVSANTYNPYDTTPKKRPPPPKLPPVIPTTSPITPLCPCCVGDYNVIPNSCDVAVTVYNIGYYQDRVITSRLVCQTSTTYPCVSTPSVAHNVSYVNINSRFGGSAYIQSVTLTGPWIVDPAVRFPLLIGAWSRGLNLPIKYVTAGNPDTTIRWGTDFGTLTVQTSRSRNVLNLAGLWQLDGEQVYYPQLQAQRYSEPGVNDISNVLGIKPVWVQVPTQLNSYGAPANQFGSSLLTGEEVPVRWWISAEPAKKVSFRMVGTWRHPYSTTPVYIYNPDITIRPLPAKCPPLFSPAIGCRTSFTATMPPAFDYTQPLSSQFVGGITDMNGLSTGFRFVHTTSLGTSGFVPSLISFNKSIEALTLIPTFPSNPTKYDIAQENRLGVTLAPPLGVLAVNATLKASAARAAQEAGVWFGCSVSTYVRFGIFRPKTDAKWLFQAKFVRNDVVIGSESVNFPFNILPDTAYNLSLIARAGDKTVTPVYSFPGGDTNILQSFAVPDLCFWSEGTVPGAIPASADSLSTAGIYASTPVTVKHHIKFDFSYFNAYAYGSPYRAVVPQQKTLFTQLAGDAQTFFPGRGYTLGRDFVANQPFGFSTSGEGPPPFGAPFLNYMDPTWNWPSPLCGTFPNNCGNQWRWWPLRDSAGKFVPNGYIGLLDYALGNFDYNDNVFIIQNVRPFNLPGIVPKPPPQAVTPGGY